MNDYPITDLEVVLIDAAGNLRMSQRKCRALRLMAAKKGKGTGAIRDIVSRRGAQRVLVLTSAADRAKARTLRKG